MILLSVTGLFRTVLIILGVIFLLRLLGKMAQARRNIAEEKQMRHEEDINRKMVQNARENYGKTSISKLEKGSVSDSDYTDFEEVDS